jgi:translation initiation factor IF-3
VKVTIMFRGREVTHPERGTVILDRLAEELAEFGVVEQRPIQEGRNMTMMMAPSKAVLAGKTDTDEAADEVFTEGERGDVAEMALESPLGKEVVETGESAVPSEAEAAADGAATPAEESAAEPAGADGSPTEPAAGETADAAADTAVS